MVVAISIAGLSCAAIPGAARCGSGKTSPESGFIALLILTLMLSYLGGMSAGDESQAGQAIWWTHTLSLLIFLPLIPHTKHLHLVLSPATVFLEREGFSRIPQLSGDEDFGLDTGKDVTRIDALQAFSCVECGRCTEHCPASNTGKVLNPKEIVLGLRGYLNELGPANEAPLLGKYISEEAVFQCTRAGGCEFQCPVGIQHLPMMIGLRRGAMNTGKCGRMTLRHQAVPQPGAQRQRPRIRGRRAAEVHREERTAAYDGLLRNTALARLYGRLRSAGREIVTALARVLQNAGVTLGAAQGEVHRRSGATARQRSGVHAGGGE